MNLNMINSTVKIIIAQNSIHQCTVTAQYNIIITEVKNYIFCVLKIVFYDVFSPYSKQYTYTSS